MEKIKHNTFDTSALIFPLPELTGSIQHIRKRYTRDGAGGMLPHLTLHYPFVDSAESFRRNEERLRLLCASFSPFTLEINDLDRFAENGVLFMKPESDEDLKRMIRSTARAFPGMPPYHGKIKIEDIEPHVTLATVEPGELQRIEAELSPILSSLLPVTVHITELWLAMRKEETWYRYKEYTLGES